MDLWRGSVWVNVTLFFFNVMMLYNPAYAQQASYEVSPAQLTQQARISVTYIHESDASRLIAELRHRGYTVREGSWAQLQQLAQVEATAPQPGADKAVKTRPDKRQGDVKAKAKDCEDQNTAHSTRSGQPAEHKENATQPGQKQAETSGSAPRDKECPPNKSQTPTKQRDKTSQDNPMPVTMPEPAEAQPPPPQAPPPPVQTTVTVQPNVSVQGNISYGSHHGNSDAAKVFFLLAGVVVIAAFIVYAGKTVYEFVHNDDAKLWWELVFNSTFMDTPSREHGRFYGAKLATGLVSSDLFQLALVGEVGNADIDLVLNENTDPQRLRFTAGYWMLGGAVRMHLTDKLVNASYLYMELLGGTTSNNATDTIGSARLGASFGINDTLRLGASIGAQYLGLNKDQGFANDGNNYWYTLGLEIGARF